MQFTHFMTRTEDGAIHCNACQWRCVLRPGEVGRCLMRKGGDEGIIPINHGLISAATVSPIEEFRLWHFFPDSMVLAVGGWGYNFPVDQQRGAYAHIPQEPGKQRTLPAEKAATFALKQLCRGVIWAYSEPSVSPEYVLDLLKTSRAASRYTALVTTGFLTVEILNKLGPYLHGISLDVRGFGDVEYERLAGVPKWRGILGFAALARERWKCHIEVTTRMHPGVNDDPDHLRQMVDWIRQKLGSQTPWHVLPGDAGSQAAAAVNRARRIGHEGGLLFVYGPEPNQVTRCPACQSTLITRENGVSRLIGLDNGRCANCGFEVDLYLSIWRKKN
ncbi:MAG: radical SAM protein [Chloroflexaceae bacterium]|nr:radical SAM protein [Chloroflexaceae bacterium]